jgi:hypothetical protein
MTATELERVIAEKQRTIDNEQIGLKALPNSYRGSNHRRLGNQAPQRPGARIEMTTQQAVDKIHDALDQMTPQRKAISQQRLISTRQSEIHCTTFSFATSMVQ